MVVVERVVRNSCVSTFFKKNESGGRRNECIYTFIRHLYMRKKNQVFAIIRFDEFLDANGAIEDKITVKEIVDTIEIAKDEVVRLNKLNSDKKCKYFWQTTRYLDLNEKSDINE
jgi:hypothetical protein